MRRHQIPFLIFTLAVISLLLGCAEREDAVMPYGSGGSALVYISTTQVRGTAKDVAVVGNLAYVADEPFGISIYDVTDPSQPQLVDSLDLVNSTKADLIAVDASGRIAAVQTDGDIKIYDLATKEFLMNRGSRGHVDIEVYFEDNVMRLFRCDTDAGDGFNYETFTNTGSEDTLSFSSSPDLSSQYKELYSLYGFCLGSNNTGYITRNSAGLAVVDYGVSGSAEVLGELNLPGKVRDAALKGENVLCLAAGYEGIITVNVSDPDYLELLGSLRIEYATDIEWVEVMGDRAYLLDDNDGVFVVEVSNPFLPTLIGEMPLSDPNHFFVTEDFVFVADEDMGLVIGQIVY